MLLCDRKLFVHVPKVGGMSITAWLLNNLDSEILLFIPESAFPHAKTTLEFEDIESRLKLLPGARHANPYRALRVLEQWKLDRPQHVITMIRPAYDLVRSSFHYFQKPRVVERLSKMEVFRQDLELAERKDFVEFARSGSILGRSPEDVLKYYDGAWDGIEFDIVPLRLAAPYLKHRFEDQQSYGRMPLGHRNRSGSKHNEDMTARKIIENRFSALQEIYETNLELWSKRLA